ncbi:Spc7 kinetochore protein-domain-containing protein [Mycena floridula]|nr:Spc7 kinetochore protein-domain-containing protein [Mycena floridula]
MVAHETAASRRKSIAVTKQDDPDRPKRRRRAHSTAPGDLTPLSRSRLSLGPVKSILKMFRPAPPEAPPAQSQDDANSTQSMDITQDYQAKIHDNFARKSMGRRVSFNEFAQVRKLYKEDDNSAGSSSPAASSDDPPPAPVLSNENDYPGAGKRKSVRYSTANSDMDLTTVMPAGGHQEFDSDEEFDDDADMEVTEVIRGDFLRKRSLSMGGARLPLSQVASGSRTSIASENGADESHSSYTDDTSHSSLEYTVPLAQALRPAAKDDAWLALKSMTHAAADPDQAQVEEGDSEQLDIAPGYDDSMSSMDEDSFGDGGGDRTMNLTNVLRRASSNSDWRLSLGLQETSMDESEVYGRIDIPLSTSTPRPSISQPTQPSSPILEPEPLVKPASVTRPSIFQRPSAPSPAPRLKATPDIRPISPAKPKPKGFSAAFAPPVSRPTPQKPPPTSNKRPRPSDENLDAHGPSPAKRPAIADKWKDSTVQEESHPVRSEAPKPKPLSPSKRAPFQAASASGLRKPSGSLGRRKSMAVVPSEVEEPSTIRTSPKKKAGLGLGRASLGSGSSDAWKRFDKPDGPRVVAKKLAQTESPKEPVPVEEHVSSPVRQQSPQRISAPDLSNILATPSLDDHEDSMDVDVVATEQWREGVETENLEEEEAPQISIEQFLAMTSIRFMDELTAPRRSIHPSQQLARQPRDPSDIPLAEYAIAMSIDAPQLVLYSRVSQDLQAWMEKSREDFTQAEEEAAKMTPELFIEYSRADEEGQAELLHQLQLIRTNCRELAKSDWYNWKLKWIEGLSLTAAKSFENLTTDAKTLEKIKAKVDAVVPQLQREYEEIVRELEREQAEVAEIEQCDEQYLNELRASIAEQNLEVESLRSEAEETKGQVKWLQERVQELELQKQDAKRDIAQTQQDLDRQHNSTRSEVFRMRDELETLEDLHMFRATKVTSQLFEYIYASQFRVSIPCQKFEPRLDQVTITTLASARARVKDDFPILSKFFLAAAIDRIRKLRGANIREVVQTLSDYWSSCTQVRSQLQHLGIRYPVEIEVRAGGAFAANASVLFPAHKAKALVSFVFDPETFASWPVSIRSLRCEAQVSYGLVRSETVVNEVNKRFSQATPADHFACLADACIEAQNEIDKATF